MHQPVQMEVARRSEAYELAAFLAEHGFVASPGREGIEVVYVGPGPLVADVDRVIAEWLAAGHSDLVPVRVGRRRVVLGPPAA
jgi:hypothetical protein